MQNEIKICTITILNDITTYVFKYRKINTHPSNGHNSKNLKRKSFLAE